MRFTLSSTALSSKLSALSRVINSRSSLPILGDFLMGSADMYEETSVNGKTTETRNERKRENSVKRQQETPVTTNPITLQSDSSYAITECHCTTHAQEEGNIAQRSHHVACRAVFRVARSGGGHRPFRGGKGDVLRRARLGWHRGGCDRLLSGETARGSSERARASATAGQRHDGGLRQGHEHRPAEHAHRGQLAGSVLSRNTNDRRVRQ